MWGRLVGPHFQLFSFSVMAPHCPGSAQSWLQTVLWLFTIHTYILPRGALSFQSFTGLSSCLCSASRSQFTAATFQHILPPGLRPVSCCISGPELCGELGELFIGRPEGREWEWSQALSRVERSLVTASAVLQIIYPAFVGGTNGVSPGTSLLYDVFLVFW